MCLVLYSITHPRQQEKLLIKLMPISAHSLQEVLSQMTTPFLMVAIFICVLITNVTQLIPTLSSLGHESDRSTFWIFFCFKMT